MLSPVRVLASSSVLTWLVLASPAHAEGLADDKAAHLSLGAGIAAVSYAGASTLSESRVVRFALGLSVSLAASTGKELLDAAGYGEPDPLDLAWGAVGAASGALFALGIDLLRGDDAGCAARDIDPALLRF